MGPNSWNIPVESEMKKNYPGVSHSYIDVLGMRYKLTRLMNKANGTVTSRAQRMYSWVIPISCTICLSPKPTQAIMRARANAVIIG